MTDRADMLDPADPPSPLTAEEIEQMAADWLVLEAVEFDRRWPQWPQWRTSLVDAIRAALASSPAPAGLDVDLLPDAICDVTGARHPDLVERRLVRAATRPAEDDHGPRNDPEQGPYPWEPDATRPAEDAER